jgi:hypothetical protein
MLKHFDLGLIFGVVFGVAAIIWSAYGLHDLARSPAHNIVVSHRAGAPITRAQEYWAIFFGGGLCIAMAYAFRRRQ